MIVSAPVSLCARSRRTAAWMPANASDSPGSSSRAEAVSSTCAVEAVKQADPEIGFERVDLMADRGRRHVQLLGGLA